MRAWSIEIWLVGADEQEVMPNVFEKATYNLHPSFPKPKHGECARDAFAAHDHMLMTAQSSRSPRSALTRGAGENSICRSFSPLLARAASSRSSTT